MERGPKTLSPEEIENINKKRASSDEDLEKNGADVSYNKTGELKQLIPSEKQITEMAKEMRVYICNKEALLKRLEKVNEAHAIFNKAIDAMKENAITELDEKNFKRLMHELGDTAGQLMNSIHDITWDKVALKGGWNSKNPIDKKFDWKSIQD